MTSAARFRSAAVGLVNASIAIRLGLLLAFSAALAGLCWQLVLQDLHAQLSAQGSAQALKKLRLAERRAEVRRSQAQLTQAQQEKEQIAALEAALPSASQAHAAWAAVHRASRKHALRMELFKPGPVGTEEPYPEQRAVLRLSGDFEALQAFTRTLADDSTVAIDSFSLAGRPLGQSSTVGPALVLEATLLSLHRPAAGAVPAALPAVVAAGAGASTGQAAPAMLAPVDQAGRIRSVADDSSAARLAPGVPAALSGSGIDPFASERLTSLPVPDATSSALTKPLHAFPLSSMRMVGSVRAGEQVAALLLVGGALHAVRQGDGLGNGRGKVAEIRQDGLTVIEPPGAGQSKVRSLTLPLAKD